MIFELKQSEKVAHLFKDWQETLIWSCLQNVMGQLFTNNVEEPISAMAILGDFCFLPGNRIENLSYLNQRAVSGIL